MKANLHIATAAISALLAAGSIATAEIPIKTQRALQDKAPEKLQIEILNVQKKRKPWGGIDLEIDGKVILVEASETKLKAGERLTIRYWLHDPEKPVPSGSCPIEVEKGKKYKAYLGPPSEAHRDLAERKAKIYFPSAASGSFEQLSAGPPRHRKEDAE